jgi:signal recognition particle subunit SRP54
MFDALTDHLQAVFKTLGGNTKLTPENIEEAIREVRKSLLEADVSLKVVKLFISRVRQNALGVEVLESILPGQQFIKVVQDELVSILGKENVPLDLKGGPGMIMLLGLQGSGKTTTAGKLAAKLKKDGFKPLLVACDIQRPAAIAQLQTLGSQVGVPVFTSVDNNDVSAIVRDALAEAKKLGLNPLIIDTAGRLQIDTELMAEILLLDRAFEPSEKLLVVDAMTGQEAVNVAETFNTQLDVTGIILTKIDGDARGGAALSVREAVGKPIKFISTGEKLDALEAFYPDRMASRILGMGDVLSLVEKAQQNIDEKEAEKMAKDMLQGDFTLEMFINAQRMMRKMGPMGQIMKMMGVGGMLGINSEQQDALATEGEALLGKYGVACDSMTKFEKQHPEKIDFGRRRRIAKGAGIQENEIAQMLKAFEQMRAMFQQLRGLLGGMGGMSGLASSGMPFGLPGGFGGAPSGTDSSAIGKTPAARNPSGKPSLPFGDFGKRVPPPPPNFPFSGPGGGYYGKKKKRR